MLKKIFDFTEKKIKKPIEPKELEVYIELDTKVEFIILDGVKDPLIPHFSGKAVPMRYGKIFRISSRIRMRTNCWCYRIS